MFARDLLVSWCLLAAISRSIIIEHVCVHHCLLKGGCLESGVGSRESGVGSRGSWSTSIEPSAGLGRSDNVARFMPLALESIVGL